jgi:hypothetical protein
LPLESALQSARLGVELAQQIFAKQKGLKKQPHLFTDKLVDV